MRAEEFAIQIAADSVAKLRWVDVWRVLESCPLSSKTNPNGTARKVAAYIKKNRLGGAYVWALNDDDASGSLTKTIAAGLK